MRPKKEKSDTIVLIPARLGSCRLSQKVIRSINGVPLIVHVANRIKKMKIGKVVVASGDEKISRILDRNNITSHITLKSHKSGSDRIYEIYERFYKGYQIIVNLQGDMPYFSSDLIKETLKLMNDNTVDIATSAIKLAEEKRSNLNVVKVKVKMNSKEVGFAEDFFRNHSPLKDLYHHIGIYVYTSLSLKKFIGLKQTRNEKNRKLEQMRALDNNLKIKVALTSHEPISVDSISDLRKARYFYKRRFKNNAED